MPRGPTAACHPQISEQLQRRLATTATTLQEHVGEDEEVKGLFSQRPVGLVRQGLRDVAVLIANVFREQLRELLDQGPPTLHPFEDRQGTWEASQQVPADDEREELRRGAAAQGARGDAGGLK